MSNILKRKNEEVEPLSAEGDQINKRVALDSEQLEESEKKEEQSQTAPTLSDNVSSDKDTSTSSEDVTSKKEVPPSAAAWTDNTLISSEPAEYDLASSALKPVYREKEDATTVSLRMYCPVKEAGVIVGKKGETITHLREKANVRINVSENLKNVPERIVSVKGSAENVARAFGLITRVILEEPEDEPASIMSKQYNLRLLIPHPLVGYVIGKSGSKFREIEENSAAKLKAAEQPLPYSTDRVLAVNGVGDAIHIAVYYISQVLLEHKDVLKKHKIVLYNPANYRHQMPTANPLQNMAIAPQQPPQMPFMGAPQNMSPLQGLTGIPGVTDPKAAYQKTAKPYNFQMMFQPSVRPEFSSPQPQPHMSQPQMAAPPMNIPPQNSFTDEHGNTIVGDVITQMPTQISQTPEKYNEDVYVANSNIGSVIGKGGNNIKQIRETSGCTYVKIEPDQNQTLLLGGGKGVTNVRKLTLTGSYNAIQTAIFLINQRISADKERNGVQ